MFTSIDFSKYLGQLMESLNSTYRYPGKDIRYIINASRIEFDIDTAIPLGLITNELATNAYKYAFSEQTEGIIEIIVRKIQGNRYKFEISDNGKGLPEDLDIERATTLGLKLVKLLTRQIEGKIDIIRKAGTTISIVF